MVYVKNIRLEGNIASMDCYINNKPLRRFFLKFNVETREIIENTCTEEFMYAGMVRANIIRTLQEGKELPEHTCVAWC